MHLLLGSIGMGAQIYTYIIEALYGADRCSTHGNGLASMCNQFLNGGAFYRYELGMHLMPAYLL